MIITFNSHYIICRALSQNATVVADAVQQRTTKCLPAEECRRLLSRHGKIKEKMCHQTFPEVNIRQGFLKTCTSIMQAMILLP